MEEKIQLTKEQRIGLLKIAVQEGIDNIEDMLSLAVINLILNHAGETPSNLSAKQIIAKWKAANQQNPEIGFIEFAKSLN